MTTNKVFEKMLKVMTDPEFQHHDKQLTIKMVHEIDDETMCEGYVIDYTNTDYSGCIFMEKPSGDFPITIIEVFMEVKYESGQPVGLIFYDDKEKHNRLFSGPIFDSLKNPFCQIFLASESSVEDSSYPYDVWMKKQIILDGLRNLIDMTVYRLVMDM